MIPQHYQHLSLRRCHFKAVDLCSICEGSWTSFLETNGSEDTPQRTLKSKLALT